MDREPSITAENAMLDESIPHALATDLQPRSADDPAPPGPATSPVMAWNEWDQIGRAHV